MSIGGSSFGHLIGGAGPAVAGVVVVTAPPDVIVTVTRRKDENQKMAVHVAKNQAVTVNGVEQP